MIAAAVLLLAAGCGGQRPARPAATARAGFAPPPYAAPQTMTVTASPSPVIVLPPSQPAYGAPAPTQPVVSIAGKTVILDAGHGGHDEGTSHFGLREKDINLDLTLRTAALLRARGVAVIMTRQSDQFVPLPERSAVANRSPNATLVSIHTNAAPNNPAASGIETFVLSQEFTDQDRGRHVAERYRMNGQDSEQGRQALANLAVQSRSRGPALASSLQQTLCARLGEADRGVKTKNLAVLRETYFGPAALVEVGFLTNPQSAQKMASADWRNRTAGAIADGIAAFLAT
jgi:N-acetylmuramoyl-L-alanine amidase